MLFSEPKISQLERLCCHRVTPPGFSALQRAENFSIHEPHRSLRVPVSVSVLFSEPKISQCAKELQVRVFSKSFSALQRAENFSIEHAQRRCPRQRSFQCSSASRKFLNTEAAPIRGPPPSEFQCSSASRKFLNAVRRARAARRALVVSVLFSEPKISQSRLVRKAIGSQADVSVLFSEPKISQSEETKSPAPAKRGFSALQRAENFSMKDYVTLSGMFGKFQCSSASRKFLNSPAQPPRERGVGFQCSSASRKFLNYHVRRFIWLDNYVSVLFSEPKISQYHSSLAERGATRVSVLFSEPKISQLAPCCQPINDPNTFQCSSASRKFLNCVGWLHNGSAR